MPYCGIEAFKLEPRRVLSPMPHGGMPYCGIEATMVRFFIEVYW